MAHPLKQRINQLTSQELDDLASVLGAVLHETGRLAKWLLSEEGEDAVTTARITVLSKVLGIDPPTK